MGAFPMTAMVNLKFVDSEKIENRRHKDQFERDRWHLVPGGFGNRGIEGMLQAIEYARVNRVPVFRDLSRHADSCHRICPQCLRTREGEQ